MNRTKDQIIEAVTVCVFYSDFLKYCIDNKNKLDRWIIVTVESDVETIELCKEHDIEYVLSNQAFSLEKNLENPESTNGIHSKPEKIKRLSKAAQEFIKTIPFNGKTLAKGRCINDGLAKLNRTGWILHLDCDIILPNDFREQIKKIPLTLKNKKSLFGVKGRRILGARPSFVGAFDLEKNRAYHKIYYKKWAECLNKKNQPPHFLVKAHQEALQQTNIQAQAGPIRAQWNHFVQRKWFKLIYPFDGPDTEHLGFFQLFHSSYRIKYFQKSNHIGIDDVLFRESFPKKYRKILNIECVHICLPSSGMLDLPHLDSCVLQAAKSSRFEHIRRQIKNKKKYVSRLTRFSASRLQSVEITNFNLKPQWSLWQNTISQVSAQTELSSTELKVVHKFSPSRESPWFGLSLTSKNVSTEKKMDGLLFEIKPQNLNCALDVGFGNKNRMEWVEVKESFLRNNVWQNFMIEFSPFFTKQNSDITFAIRSRGDYTNGDLFLGAIHYLSKKSDLGKKSS